MTTEDRLLSESVCTPSGGLIRFQSRLGDFGCWLTPAWATLCGVVASEGFNWRTGNDWLRLVFLLLLTDGVWGTLWAALAHTDWAGPLGRWRRWSAGVSLVTLPYTQHGTPGHRVSRWLAQLRCWWQQDLWPACGNALAAMVVALPVGAAISLFLGPEFLLLGLGALALMQLGTGWEAGSGQVTPGWDALIAVLLPWLAGHLAFASLTESSVGLALALALAYGVAWSLAHSWAQVLMVVAYALAAALLLALRAPLAAVSLGVLLVPQLALLPWLCRGQSPAWYVQSTRLWWLIAALVASWAL
jgi:hypothetical protein